MFFRQFETIHFQKLTKKKQNFNWTQTFGTYSNLILRGYIFAVTHIVTQFSHVSRHLKFRIGNKLIFFRENCFEKELVLSL